jgi:hypothetical protein
MIEILQFVFSSFWIWAGTVILCCVTVAPLAAGIGAGLASRGDK